MKITKAAILIFRTHSGQKEVMFVRAGDKPYLVLPGGKLELDESRNEALQRELIEELGTTSNDAEYLGSVRGKTPDGRDIEEHIYLGSLQDVPKASSEIADIVWISKADLQSKREDMTPLTLQMIVPFIDNHNLWD